jgi:hypothetical protein
VLFALIGELFRRSTITGLICIVRAGEAVRALGGLDAGEVTEAVVLDFCFVGARVVEG